MFHILGTHQGLPICTRTRVLRKEVNGSNQLEDIVTGLVVPTGLTTGPDGALYLSNFGAAPASLGQILRVELAD